MINYQLTILNVIEYKTVNIILAIYMKILRKV